MNKYFRRLFSDKSNDKQVIKIMKDKLHVDNELQKIVQNELKSKTKFDKLDFSYISDFPKLEVDEII